DRDRIAGDRKVLDGAQGVDAVVRLIRDGAIAEQIVLDSLLVSGHGASPATGWIFGGGANGLVVRISGLRGCRNHATVRPGADLFRWLSHRLEYRFELRAHGDAQGFAGGQPAKEPLLV